MFGFIGDVIGGVLGYKGQSSANEANLDIARENNAFNAQQAQYARDFNEQQAGINREFQADMRNTQYQAAVQDMKKAGLNPMLAYSQGGAGTPSGATASGPAASAAPVAPMQNTMTSAVQTMQAATALDNMRKQGDVLEAQAFATRAKGWRDQAEATNAGPQGDNIRADTQLKANSARNAELGAKQIEAQTDQIRTAIEKIKVETEHEGVKIGATQSLSDLNNAHELYTRGKIGMQDYEQRIKAATASLIEYALPGAKNIAHAQDSAIGEASAYFRVLPLSELLSILGSIRSIK